MTEMRFGPSGHINKEAPTSWDVQDSLKYFKLNSRFTLDYFCKFTGFERDLARYHLKAMKCVEKPVLPRGGVSRNSDSTYSKIFEPGSRCEGCANLNKGCALRDKIIRKIA